MRFKFRMIALPIMLGIVSSGCDSDYRLPVTGAGGSSRPGMVSPNRDVGMVIIKGEYYAYSITTCEFGKGKLLALDGEGTTDSGRPFRVKVRGVKPLIELYIDGAGEVPAERYASAPFDADDAGFEIKDRTVSASIMFQRVGLADLLPGSFRAECR